MPRLLPAIALICLSIPGRAAQAREFQVRLLKGSEREGVWGTKEFQVRVSASGRLRYLEVRGRQVLDQAAALYGWPFPRDSKRPMRLVQGDASPAGRPWLNPPEMTTRDENGKRVFRFRYAIAHKKVLAGQELCAVK